MSCYQLQKTAGFQGLSANDARVRQRLPVTVFAGPQRPHRLEPLSKFTRLQDCETGFMDPNSEVTKWPRSPASLDQQLDGFRGTGTGSRNERRTAKAVPFLEIGTCLW